jgi:endonuclease-3
MDTQKRQLRSHTKHLVDLQKQIHSNNDVNNHVTNNTAEFIEPMFIKKEEQVGNERTDSASTMEIQKLNPKHATTKRRRRTGEIIYENENNNENFDETKRKIKIEEDAISSGLLKSEPLINPFAETKPLQGKKLKIEKYSEPPHWKDVYDAIVEMRIRRDAAVDTQGCAKLAISQDAKTFRFQTLIALMLSSQTKDQVTADAMKKLNALWPDGLNLENVRAASTATVHSAITNVGFHQRKVDFIKRTSEILHEKYSDDIPDTVEGLCELPGVGPKMAFLCMQVGWKRNVGIGVDVHVHRISNRLGWTAFANGGKPTKTPEQTRLALESWLPKSLWTEVNILLVGFGQQICTPLRPACEECKANQWCPEGQTHLARIAKGLKPLIITKAVMLSKSSGKKKA